MIFIFICILLLPIGNHSDKEFQLEILKEVNALRTKGCYCGDTYVPRVKTVKWNQLLAKSALLHARDMHEKKYFSHIERKGKDIGDRAHAVGYKWMFIGENIAEGQVNISEVMEDWLKSYDHCLLLMNGNFDEMGVSRYGNIWVQHFGRRKRQ